MDWNKRRLQFSGHLALLIVCAFLLMTRLIYLYIADPERFPISTVKIAATYEHISRQQLETLLSSYLHASFFVLPIKKLSRDLQSLDWADSVEIKRIWPNTLKITLVEKTPAAIWNNQLITDDGAYLGHDNKLDNLSLPKLTGPDNQQLDVLQNYQKLSKLLATTDLRIASLHLRKNQAWDLTLTNGIKLQLGKRDLEQRLKRFCSAYPAIFADKYEQLFNVDLRYARGMAVQWKQQTGR